MDDDQNGINARSAKMLRERRRVLGNNFEEFEDNFLDGNELTPFLDQIH